MAELDPRTRKVYASVADQALAQLSPAGYRALLEQLLEDQLCPHQTSLGAAQTAADWRLAQFQLLLGSVLGRAASTEMLVAAATVTPRDALPALRGESPWLYLSLDPAPRWVWLAPRLRLGLAALLNVRGPDLDGTLAPPGRVGRREVLAPVRRYFRRLVAAVAAAPDLLLDDFLATGRFLSAFEVELPVLQSTLPWLPFGPPESWQLAQGEDPLSRLRAGGRLE